MSVRSCVDQCMSAVNLFKRQGRGFERMGCAVDRVDREGVAEK